MRMKNKIFPLILCILLCSSVSYSATIANSYSVGKTIPRGSSADYFVPISGAPSNAVIDNVEAKFTYTAYNGVEDWLSCRFNRGSDPGSYGGAVLVSQGALPGGNPGSYPTSGYKSFSNWDGQGVNTSYYFNFKMADATAYDPTIHTIYVVVTYHVPAPDPPSLVSPSNYYVKYNSTPHSFDWSSVSDAEKYRIYVDNNSGFGSPEINTERTGSDLSSSTTLADNVYFWKVQAYSSSGGWGDWSFTRMICVDKPPSSPTLSSPSNAQAIDIGSTISFSWYGPSGYSINRYYLRIVPGTNLNNSAIADNELESTSKSISTGGWSPGTYTWGVRAIKDTPSGFSQTSYENAIGWGPYSSRTFFLQYPVDPRVSVSPSSGTDGTVFQQPGSGFTPNGQATLNFSGPDGGGTVSKTVGSDGAYAHSWTCDDCPTGAYQYYAKDNATGVNSNTVTFRIAKPQVSVSPASGTDGTVFQQPGSGFTSNGQATLYFSGPDGGGTVSKSVGSDGVYAHSWTCDDCPTGTYQYYAKDNATGVNSNTVTFRIAKPQVSVSPASGTDGTVFQQPGSGFTPNGQATLYFSGPDGGGTVSKSVGSDGTYSHSWTCDDCPTGAYQYYAKDNATGVNSNTVTFRIAKPQVSVSPASGTDGTVFQQPGSGFTPNGQATLYFSGPDGGGTVSKSVGSDGTYSHSWTCDDCPTGAYQYYAKDNATGVDSNTVTFRIAKPQVSVSPASGTDGTVFQQPGSGFTPNGQATLYFSGPDGGGTVSKSVGSDGTYSHSWTCDDCPTGAYQYYAKDNATGVDSNTVTFRIAKPQVSVSPASGTNGTVFQQPGSGFTPDSTAILHFTGPDGDTDPVTKNTDSNGAYTHSWTCENCPVGAYLYWAVDSATGVASNTASFSVDLAFGLVSPEDNSTKNARGLVFEWSEAPGATGYEIIVDNNQDFSSPEINEPGFRVQTLESTRYETENWLPSDQYFWKVNAILPDGSKVSSATWSFEYALPTENDPVWVPFYRTYRYEQSENKRDHFYTANRAENDNAVTNLNYKNEGVECYVSDRIFDGGTPLFRLYHSSQKSHYYTTDINDKDSRISEGYRYEGIAGFAAQAFSEGLVPLHRLRQLSGTPFHTFLCTNKSEYAAVLGNGYADEDSGTIGYVQSHLARDPIAHGRPQANFGSVDLASGALRGVNSKDLVMRGKGPNLVFSHYYNSFDRNHYPYPMGPGWNHGLESQIHEDIFGNVIVEWRNGNISVFAKTGEGASDYEDLTGNHDILTKIEDGANYGYDILRRKQSRYKYREFSVSPWPGTPREEWFLQDNSRILLVEIGDWAGNKLTYEREAAYGTVQSVSDSYGRKLECEYSTKLQLEVVREVVDGVAKRSVSFAYDSDGVLQSFTDANGKTTRYGYGQDGYLESIQYPRGNATTIGYGSDGRVETIRVGDDPVSRISYDFASEHEKITRVEDPKGKIFTFFSDAFNLVAQNGPTQNPASLEYGDPNNPFKPTRIEDRKGNATELRYDSMGNLVEATNAKGNVATFSYNAKNNLTSTTEFHAQGTSVPATTLSYDMDGNRVVSMSNPENETAVFHYDSVTADLVVSIENGLGYHTGFEYDSYGNLKSVTDAEGNVTRYENDYAGRVKTVIDAESKYTWYTYDFLDNLRSVKNHLNLVVDLDYNDNGFLERVSWVNDGTLSETAYAYDDEDRLETVINPLGFQMNYAYDEAGRLKSRNDYNSTLTTYSHDDNGQLERTDYPDYSVSIGRDENGKITSVHAPAGASSFQYDELNMMKKYTDPFGMEVSYEYDDAGRLWKLIYPGNKTVTYGYDDAGRLESVADWLGGVTTYIYDGAGNLKEIHRPNGTKAFYEYDRASRLVVLSEEKSDGTIICAYAYELDGVGNHKAVDAQEPLEAVYEPKDIEYTYDKKTNRLLCAGNVTYLYDNNGNRVSSSGNGGTLYSWNPNNMLASIDATTPPYSIRYVYNGLGNRIGREENGITSRYVLDLRNEQNKVLAETNNDENIVCWYVYGIGLSSVVYENGTQLFFHFNSRGDTIAVSDSSGVVKNAYSYDSFGLVYEMNANFEIPFKFIGKHGVMTESLGLFFMRHRYYDSDIGRFLSTDPLGFGGNSWNIYSYANQNPLCRIDPTGTKGKGLGIYETSKFVYEAGLWSFEAFFCGILGCEPDDPFEILEDAPYFIGVVVSLYHDVKKFKSEENRTPEEVMEFVTDWIIKSSLEFGGYSAEGLASEFIDAFEDGWDSLMDWAWGKIDE